MQYVHTPPTAAIITHTTLQLHTKGLKSDERKELYFDSYMTNQQVEMTTYMYIQCIQQVEMLPYMFIQCIQQGEMSPYVCSMYVFLYIPDHDFKLQYRAMICYEQV